MSTSKLADSGIQFSMESRLSEELTAFFVACEAEQIEPLSLFVDLKEFAEKLTEKAKIIYALRQNEIVGVCAFYHNPAPLDSYLSVILVRSNVRNIGVGNKMMLQMIDYCSDSAGIMLEVSEANTFAIPWYEKFGFSNKESVFNNQARRTHHMMYLRSSNIPEE